MLGRKPWQGEKVDSILLDEIFGLTNRDGLPYPKKVK
jgi:hypothetical protein